MSTKINSYPKTIGYTEGQKIILPQAFRNISQSTAEDLIDWTEDEFIKNLPSLFSADFWDMDYKSRQFGLSLAEIDPTDVKKLKLFYEKVGIDYMLLAEVTMRDNYLARENDPNYMTKEAKLQLQLVDFKYGVVIWRCDTKVRISPLEVRKEDGSTNTFQFSGTHSAFLKAYRKSIRRLLKDFQLIKL